MLAEPRGFCAGVEMAIKALAWMVRAFEPPVYCYHEIVHNRLVVDRFREQGVIFVDDVADVPPGAPLMLSAHGSAPEVVDAARAEGRYVVNAVCPLVTKVHHEAQGAGPQGLHDPLRRPRRPRRSGRHARGRARRRSGWSSAPTTSTSVLARGRRSGPGRDARADHARAQRVDRACSTQRANAFPRRVDRVAQRPLLRDHQPPGRAHRDRAARRRGRRDRQRELVEHASRSTKVARDAGCPIVLRVDGPDELDLDALGDARIVGVTAGASAPEELVDAVIAKLAPAQGVERVRVTDEDEYFPPPPRAARADPRARRRGRVRVRRRPAPGARARADRSPTTAASTRRRCSPSLDG